jgi:hypothetical protein
MATFSLDFLASVDPTKLDWKNPVGIALMLAEKIETVPGLKGQQKLAVLKHALTQLAKTAGIYSAEFEMFLENVLPSVVQAAVSVSKGEVNLKTIEVVAHGCCLPLLQTGIALLSKKKD